MPLTRIRIIPKICCILIYILSISCNESSSIDSLNDELYLKKPVPIALNVVEYIKYLNDTSNGFIISKKNNGFTFNLQLIPPRFHAIRQYKGNVSVENNIFDSLTKGLSNYQYFILNIQSDSCPGNILKCFSENIEDEKILNKYYSFDVQHDFKIINSLDTIDCLFSQFEQVSDLGKGLMFNIYFDAQRNDNELKVVFVDKYLGFANIEFRFAKSSIEQEVLIKII